MYGEIPNSSIDHINNIKDDNRICNLRLANNGQQKFNTQAHRNNRLGVKGIRQTRSGFQARITGPNGLKTIGTYITLSEAKNAYANEALKIHNEFIHPSVKENIS